MSSGITELAEAATRLPSAHIPVRLWRCEAGGR